MIADILKQNKVNNSGMRFDPNVRTALAFVTLRADGEREFLFYHNPSADMLLKESKLDKELLGQARILQYGSISLIDEPCRSSHLAAMEIVKKAGDFLFYDPNLRKQLWPSEEAARVGIMCIWNQADMIKIFGMTSSFTDHPGAVPITTAQGEELRKLIGAPAYIECRSKTQQVGVNCQVESVSPFNLQNIKAIFDAAIKVMDASATKIVLV